MVSPLAVAMRPRFRLGPRRPRALQALALLACGGGAAGRPGAQSLASIVDDGHCPVDLGPATSMVGSADAEMFGRYLEACKSMQVRPSADVLVSLQLGSDRLKPRPSSGEAFGDLETRALAILLEESDGAKLQGLRHLDLSLCSLGPSGMLLVSRLLRHPKCQLETLDISNQEVDHESLCNLVSALGQSKSMRLLHMKSCHLGDAGAAIIMNLMANRSSAQPLEEINIENNYISAAVCNDIAKAAKEVDVDVRLAGNRVLDEVFNSVSHGLGLVLAIVGTVFLAKKMGCDKPLYQVWAMTMYCAALNIMYLSSTLYHSFFALGRTTVYIFSVLDYSGIFLLIAGSYSPFLGIALYEEVYAAILLVLMWAAALIGIFTAAFYTGPFAIVIRLTLYISMGWVIVVCIRPLARKIGNWGAFFLFLGGVSYTGGVYFFVRKRHTFGLPDHTIWHLFVVAGTVLHYGVVYKCVLNDKEARCSLPSVPPSEDEYMAVRTTPPSEGDEYMAPRGSRPLEVPLSPL